MLQLFYIKTSLLSAHLVAATVAAADDWREMKAQGEDTSLLTVDNRVRTLLCWQWTTGWGHFSADSGQQGEDTSLLTVDNRVRTLLCWQWTTGWGHFSADSGQQGEDNSLLTVDNRVRTLLCWQWTTGWGQFSADSGQQELTDGSSTWMWTPLLLMGGRLGGGRGGGRKDVEVGGGEEGTEGGYPWNPHIQDTLHTTKISNQLWTPLVGYRSWAASVDYGDTEGQQLWNTGHTWNQISYMHFQCWVAKRWTYLKPNQLYALSMLSCETLDILETKSAICTFNVELWNTGHTWNQISYMHFQCWVVKHWTYLKPNQLHALSMLSCETLDILETKSATCTFNVELSNTGHPWNWLRYMLQTPSVLSCKTLNISGTDLGTAGISVLSCKTLNISGTDLGTAGISVLSCKTLNISGTDLGTAGTSVLSCKTLNIPGTDLGTCCRHPQCWVQERLWVPLILS